MGRGWEQVPLLALLPGPEPMGPTPRGHAYSQREEQHRREATRSPGHQRHACSRGGGWGGGQSPVLGRSHGPADPSTHSVPGMLRKMGSPGPVRPDTTLPARQGRTCTLPTAPHCQQEGPPRGRGPPRGSSAPGAATACISSCRVLLCSLITFKS